MMMMQEMTCRFKEVLETNIALWSALAENGILVKCRTDRNAAVSWNIALRNAIWFYPSDGRKESFKQASWFDSNYSFNMITREFKGSRGNTIRFICCDNKEWMSQVEYKYYHLTISDPPYGIDVTKMNLGKTKKDLVKLKYHRGDWDSKTPDEQYFTLLFYVTRQQIIWGANYFIEHLGNCQKFYLWDKEQPDGLSFADCEFAWTSFEGAPKMIKRSRQKDFKHEKIHDTQKPIYLYDAIFTDLIEKDLLKKYQRVLDTHGGSHNIAIAAWRHSLSLDIIEVQEQHHVSGIENFIKHTQQIKIDFNAV